jgi:hypothetical protein
VKADGQIVLCAGLKSSGSTWLYNAVIQLMQASARASGERRRIRPFYAEDVKGFPLGVRQGDCLIVKTHIPSPALQFLVRFTGGTVFITVREPRDAIASLMQRFDHKFDVCLDEVSAGAAALLILAKSGRHLLLRYESNFTARRTTLNRLVTHLKVATEWNMLDKIRLNLTPGKVIQKIEALGRKGIFGRKQDPNSFDPVTQWHPGHVGDGRTGKYGEILSVAQQRAVLKRLREYCLAFGYSDSPSSIREKVG